MNTLPRVGAGLSLLAPFQWAPLVAVLFGLLMQCLPVTVLLSRRCRNLGPLSMRAAFALFYVIAPNAREIHMVLTNSQWHLALAVGLLSFGSPPEGWAGRIFDVAAFSILGLSGPFSLVLAPLLLVYFWFRRGRWTLVEAAIIGTAAAIQITLIRESAERAVGPLGAGVLVFVRMFGGNVIGGSIFGGFGVEQRAPIALMFLATIGGVALYLYVVRFARIELKLLILFCIGIFVGSLQSPLVISAEPRWKALLLDSGCRYWFFPMIAFLWGLIWCARFAQHKFFQRMATYTLMVSAIGVVLQWEYKGYPNRHFADSVQRLRDANDGTAVTIPIIPDPWSVTLVKKGPPGQIGR
jgi:hypothetical protein